MLTKMFSNVWQRYCQRLVLMLTKSLLVCVVEWSKYFEKTKKAQPNVDDVAM